jgi:hypothetical protein
VASGDRLLLTDSRRDAELRGAENRRIQLEDGRTLPVNYREFDHGYAITAHRSQGKTVDGVILSADASAWHSSGHQESADPEVESCTRHLVKQYGTGQIPENYRGRC